jgi:hypothetical protein
MIKRHPTRPRAKYGVLNANKDEQSLSLSCLVHITSPLPPSAPFSIARSADPLRIRPCHIQIESLRHARIQKMVVQKHIVQRLAAQPCATRQLNRVHDNTNVIGSLKSSGKASNRNHSEPPPPRAVRASAARSSGQLRLEHDLVHFTSNYRRLVNQDRLRGYKRPASGNCRRRGFAATLESKLTKVTNTWERRPVQHRQAWNRARMLRS